MSAVVVHGAFVLDAMEWKRSDVFVLDGVVAASLPPTGRVETIDAEGCWLIPTLTDAHCHLLPSHLRRLPIYGVGYAMDMFSTPGMRPYMDQEADQGGARYLTTGVGATVRGGHPYQLVTAGLYPDFPAVAERGGPRAFVREQIAAGSAMIKLFIDDGRLAGQVLPTLSPATASELVAEAHERNLLVVAHAPTVDLAISALEAGVDGFAHAPIPDGRTDTEEFVSAVAQRQAFMVSTLVASASALGVPQIGSLAGSPLWSRVPDRWRTHLTLQGRAAPDRPALERLLGLVALAHDHSVPVYPGTDAAFPGVMPGASLHVELELLQHCGISAPELLEVATSGLRRRLGMPTGGVQMNERAEFLLLERDPRESISATRWMRAVVLGDHIVRF